MQDRINESSRLKELLSADDLKRWEERERELTAYSAHIALREKELDDFRTKLKQEQLAREKELQKELEAREKFFADREKKLFERQKEVEEQLVRRQEESAELRMRLETREAQLHEAMKDLQLEKVRYTEESRKKIESKSKDYVSDALETLKDKERQFHLLSKIWSTIGALALASGMVFFGYISIASFTSMPPTLTWQFITFSVFKGIIAVALFGALSKYAFLFSNSYMREALKNGDRRHAINFGKFYLESYGAAAEWSQIKEAFEHWNITWSNAFNSHEDSKLEVAALKKVVEVI
jgi:hypothetical protein